MRGADEAHWGRRGGSERRIEAQRAALIYMMNGGWGGEGADAGVAERHGWGAAFRGVRLKLAADDIDMVKKKRMVARGVVPRAAPARRTATDAEPVIP